MSFSDTDMYFPDKESPVKRVGYKTLRGFIRMLKAQNKKLKKIGCRVRFIVELPIDE